MEWNRMNFWFECYTSDDMDKGITYVISKPKGKYWMTGKYDDCHVDHQPHPSKDGYLGKHRSLKQAKTQIENR